MALALLLSGSSAALADTYIVNAEGTGEFPTIQTAIEASAHGDVIELAPGTYRGAGNRDVNFLGKWITVRGQSGDPQDCIIDCDGLPEDHHRGFVIDMGEGEGARLESVTITNGYAATGGAILTDHTSAVVVNCVFIGNRAEEDGGAVHILWRSEVMVSTRLRQCTIVGNVADRGGGIAGYRAVTTIESCLIADNRARLGGGCFFENSPSSVFTSTVAGNLADEEAGGIWGSDFLEFSNGVLWNNCSVAGSDEGFFLDNSPGYPLFRCSVVDMNEVVSTTVSYVQAIFEDPQFCRPRPPCAAPNGMPGDYAVTTASPCLPGNNDCGVLIGALGEGCAKVPVEPSSWGRIKEIYRSP